MTNRYWLHPAGRDSKLLTGPQLVSANVHPLRCIYLGACESIEAANRKATPLAGTPPASVLAHNVRVACDRRQTRRWRLSEQEIDLLVGGHELKIMDSLGTFVVGYVKTG